MLVNPDFTEAAEQKPVPAGTYSARIKGVEAKEAKDSGNKYLNWKLELYGSEEVKNRVVYLMTMLTGKASFRLRDLYQAATGETISDKQSFDTDVLIGKEIKVTLADAFDQEGNLRKFPEVKAVAKLH